MSEPPMPRPDGVRPGATTTPRGNRRATAAMLSSLTVSVVIVAGYFVLPLSSAFTSATVLLLSIGLLVVVLLLVWHVRSIVQSPHPRVRAVAALATTVPVFLVVFATTYFVMSRTDPARFSEPLSRLDAAYYTMTIFATVGFGDIAPASSEARATTMVQMAGDLILVGLVAQVIVGAMRQGVRRREAEALDLTDEQP